MKIHKCTDKEGAPRTDDDGRPLVPDAKLCNTCGHAWCERCDPSPSALCHYCHGRGTSTAPVRRDHPVLKGWHFDRNIGWYERKVNA